MLPDGRAIELVYPAHLPLARLRLSMNAWVTAANCCGRDVELSARDQSPTELFGHVTSTYRGRDGRPVTVRRQASSDGEPATETLVFEFGRWYLSVPLDNQTSDGAWRDLGAVARSLSVTVTPNGYPRLQADPPFRSASFRPNVDGPFRGDLSLQSSEMIIEVMRNPACSGKPKTETGGGQAELTMCTNGFEVHASNTANQGRTILDELARSLQVRAGG
ncbi:hypothetical protein SMC26_17605 [Actinomadura fulvescens]